MRRWWAASGGVERRALQGSSAEVRRGQRAKAIRFLVLFCMEGLTKRLWRGGGGIGCLVVFGVADAVCGGRLGVAGVVGLGVGGGALEGLLLVIRGGGSRSRDILRAGDWAWGGLDECALSRMSVRGTLRGRGGMGFGRGSWVGVVGHCASEGWIAISGMCASIGSLGGIRLCGGFRRGRRAM